MRLEKLQNLLKEKRFPFTYLRKMVAEVLI